MMDTYRVANCGAFVCFRDEGMFHKQFSLPGKDVGVVMKEMQILNYGNDSYGALSGHDLLAMALGLEGLLDESAVRHAAHQATALAELLRARGVPGVLDGGYAVFLDMDAFFADVPAQPAGIDDLRGLGLVTELVRLYGVRASEFGPHTFGMRGAVHPNMVRFAIPHGAYAQNHLEYIAAAVAELYRLRAHIPNMHPAPDAPAVSVALPAVTVPMEPLYPASGPITPASL